MRAGVPAVNGVPAAPDLLLLLAAGVHIVATYCAVAGIPSIAGIPTSAGVPPFQEVTKRCRLSWLTNSAPHIRVQCGGRGGVAVAGSQPISTDVHIT